MLEKGMTIQDATRKWVSEFSRFPWDMIRKLIEVDRESWVEVTMPSIGDYVYINVLPKKDIDGNEYDSSKNEGKIVEVKEDNVYLVKLYNGVKIQVNKDFIEVKRDDFLPMRGWLWQFEDSCDNYWLEEKEGIRSMSECGFRIYRQDAWGYFFGIDGAGYDFYEAHWIPAYKKRGLCWHDLTIENSK